MENNDSLLPERMPAGMHPAPITASQSKLENDLLKKDYKKLLIDFYEKKELVEIQKRAIEELKTSVSTLAQSLTSRPAHEPIPVTQKEQLNSLLGDKEKIILEQNRKIHALYQKIDTLNIQLSEIYASEGWKLLSFYYRLRDNILPQGSERQQRMKKAINWLRGKKRDNVVIKDHAGNGKIDYRKLLPTTFDPFEFPQFAEPRVSIIIPAYNGWAMNYACLRSIRENTEGISYEVIFADDVSTDETQHIEKYIKNLVYIRNEENLGFLQNCNHAASFAKGTYLHFLNNDTIVEPGWLSSLIDLMEKDASIGMTGSKLVYPDGRLQEAGGIIWQDASGWNYGHKQDPDAPEYNYVKEVDYISGASILIRKKIWEELGGFNEMYNPAYCEDSDMAFAIRHHGYKVVYQPLSKVIHFEGFSHGTDKDMQAGVSGIKSYQKINAVKFAEKWQPVLQKQFPNGVNPFWTRDRSHGKPTIVVIDHYVPHFDKDAGSRTTFQYLELFVELGMNVKFIGDNFYKHEPYTTVLQQKGIEVLYGTYYAENWMSWLKNNDPYIDYILLNRPHVSVKYMDFIKDNLHGKVFYYTHDLHFYREMMEYEVSKDPHLLKSSLQWKETEYALFSKSDVVLTPSRKEKQILEPDFAGKSIEVMPAFFYPSISSPVTNFRDRKDVLFVGGFTHSPNTDAMLWFAGEVLPLVRERHPDLRVIVVGSNAPDVIQRLASPSVIIRGFVPDAELDQLYNNVRLAVIPLRFGAGLKGKTVESLVKGLPIVSTSFGIEGLEEIASMVQPYDTAETFAAAVAKLYDDITGLEEFSRAAVDYSQKHFTKDSAALFFRQLFNV